jgi:ribosomal protein S18 acetylase RimI-like enzyme
VAQGESEIVGFCVVRIIDGDGGAPMGILNNIFVAAEYRRRGIGLKLLTGGMEWLRRRRIANCCLEPGRNTNMVQELLSRNGFVQVSHTFHSYLTTKPS